MQPFTQIKRRIPPEKADPSFCVCSSLFCSEGGIIPEVSGDYQEDAGS